jgi:oxygen-independent coproporphyrinogen-3 oxidase
MRPGLAPKIPQKERSKAISISLAFENALSEGTFEAKCINEDLRARYGGENLPRYTSYPPAPHFTAAVSHKHYGEWLAAIPSSATGSLYLHIPFCRSMCWYCGCHTKIVQRDEPVRDYLAVLRREIELVAGELKNPFAIRHVHFGGGTPTIIAPADFLALIGLLRERFNIAPDAEIAIEIDPRTLTQAMSAALGEAGVTRASLGIQSFDLRVQESINRIQGFEETAAAAAALRAAGVLGVNFDLIYGLPHETADSCIETVAQCATLRPDRFAVFGYAHVPAFKIHQRQIDEKALPDGDARYEQAEAIANTLVAEGYERIGLDHFALPDDSMARAQKSQTLHRNFQGYTTDPSDVLIGLGASSIGRLAQGYVQNEVALPTYAERVLRGDLATAKGHWLTADDRLRGEVIERLMCNFEVDLASLCARHQPRPKRWSTRRRGSRR